MIKEMDQLFMEARTHYEHLHKHPEIGFDLPMTAAYVTEALQNIGITPTDQYGSCSVVGQIGNRKDVPTIAIRADMDALPVTEETDLPFASTIPGAVR